MKKLLITFLLLAVSGTQALALNPPDDQQMQSPFTDVNWGDEYFDALNYLKKEGIVAGYADGSFKPFQTINRVEFTKIIVEADGYDAAKGPFDMSSAADLNFKDLEDGVWYVPYLREAKNKGLIGGYPDGTFKPSQKINFAEAAKIIVVSTGGDFAGAGYAPEDWYHKYVNVLEEKHAIPRTIGGFDQEITRGEMAEMIYRLRTENEGKPSNGYADLAAPKGYLEGSLSYPSIGVPVNMIICADKTEEVVTYCTYNHIVSDKYLYGVGYRLAVPAGHYKVYAYVDTLYGSYSEFVTCGMDASHCTSHEPVEVKVEVGKTVKDIDTADWYHN
ncbi:S-layer homology domain-containing protein [Candidatus Peregrinibacteria bacterium]|nr:S-layer homology domain-containing protein [Candidatus Peregrinibacteria bacterium]